jgi:hypothetical protein
MPGGSTGGRIEPSFRDGLPIKKEGRHVLVLAFLILSISWAGYSIGKEPKNDAGYWVSPTGRAAWADARSISPLSGSDCCSLATANANITAGDVVYLRGGTYTTPICPTSSGSRDRRIVYSAYPGESVTLSVTDAEGRWAVKIVGQSYITVDGINSSKSACFFLIAYGAHHNEIRNCRFDLSSFDYALGAIQADNTAHSAQAPCTHNWIHHNQFSRYGGINEKTGQDIGTIRIGGYAYDASSNNTIEGNEFSNGGHDLLDIGGRFNVVRNNNFHNESDYFEDPGTAPNSPSPNGYFGNRCVLLSCLNTDINGSTSNAPGTASHTLIEGNKIHHSGLAPDDNGCHGIENAGAHTLIRYNSIYATELSGIYFKSQPQPAQTKGSGIRPPESWSTLEKSGSFGRVCHNTIYKVGQGVFDDYESGRYRSGIAISGVSANHGWKAWWPWPVDVKAVNNIIWGWPKDGSEASFPASASGQVLYRGNYNRDPGFVDGLTADPHSIASPDLRLVAGSPCIDAGIPLTVAKGSGSGSLFLSVDDALWFQDGTWGSELSHGVTHFADRIAIGAVDNIVQIKSIDYGSNTVILAAPATWPDGAKVWLFSDSTGRQVLYGIAPDPGAHEYRPAPVLR